MATLSLALAQEARTHRPSYALVNPDVDGGIDENGEHVLELVEGNLRITLQLPSHEHTARMVDRMIEALPAYRKAAHARRRRIIVLLERVAELASEDPRVESMLDEATRLLNP